MIQLNVQQGSQEWLVARAGCFNASEAPAMMGISPYMTRSELLRQKATGISPEVDYATQSRFELGHMAEALARPLVEKIIGEPLFPIVATDDSGKFLASSDGATMLVDTGFEHKLWNEALASEVRSGNVPESHRWQLDHQIMVFGFSRILFVVSDGTPEKMVHCWYYPQPERIKSLVDGWAQFAKDIASYVPEVSKPDVVAEKVEGLPALFVQVEGRVVASNMDAFKSAAEYFIDRLPKASELQTDQDFANADQAAKDCKEAEEKLQIVKEQAQSQAVSIDEAFRAIDTISSRIRSARLALEKVVKAEKENRKAEIVRATQSALLEHVGALQVRVGVQFNLSGVNFGDAIYGLKSLDSMRDKLSVALAKAKIEADQIADRIDANRKTVEDMSLVPDFVQVCTKDPDDFAALLAVRIAQRKESDEKRLAATRAEEQAEACVQEIQKSEPQQVLSVVSDTQKTGKTIKLGEINALLGFTVSAEFLSSIGFVATSDRSSKLYRESDFPAICRKIADHTLAAALRKAA